MIDTKNLPILHLFGDEQQWGVSLDDGCLRFHPNVIDSPTTTTNWIWREAWAEVEKMGGFDAMVQHLRCLIALADKL